MAQPAYSYKGLSEMNYSQPVMSDGGLSELGLSEVNYGQPKWIQTAPTISPAYYPAPMLAPYPLMMTQPVMGYGQLSTPYPLMMSSMPMMTPMQPASMFRYY